MELPLSVKLEHELSLLAESSWALLALNLFIYLFIKQMFILKDFELITVC